MQDSDARNVTVNNSTSFCRAAIACPSTGNGTTDPIVFGCDYDEDGVFDEDNDGKYIALAYMNWQDLCAFSDWAGLRPNTETEYEKACRGGIQSVYRDKPWGPITYPSNATNLTNAGMANESAENIGSGGAIVNTAGGNIDRPMRVGFQATSTSNRTEAVAGYYGNLNLGDNAQEMVVVLSLVESRIFEGTHGDGILTNLSSYEGTE